MADKFTAVSGTDPTTDAFWTALGYTPPANKALWSGASTTITAGYAALGTGGSDVLHVAPGTYPENFSFTTGTKVELKAYGEVILKGTGTKGTKSTTRVLTVQNGAKTFSGGLGVDSDGKNIDIFVIDGRLANNNIIYQQGTGNLTFNCDLSLIPNQIGGYGHLFNRSSAAMNLTTNGRLFILSFEHPNGANPSDSTYATADTYSANATAFAAAAGTNDQILYNINGGIYINGDLDQFFWLTNLTTTPVSKVEIIGGQVTARARYVLKTSNSGWEIATKNQFIMRGVKILPAEWEFSSRVGTATDDICNLSAGDDYRAEGCILNNSPFFNALSPTGFDASSKFNTRTVNAMRIKPRRGPVRVSLQTDDYYDTFNHLATNTVDSRVKATIALAYTSDAALTKRNTAQSYTDSTGVKNIASSINTSSIPGSTGATTWADPDIQSQFVTPMLAHIANGHELVIHSRTHSQLGYAPLFDIAATSGTTLDINMGTDSLTLTGTVSASLTISDYDEIGDLVHALAAISGVTCRFKTYTNGASVQSGDVAAQPQELADIAGQSLNVAYDCLRDWQRTYDVNIGGAITDIAAIHPDFPAVNSFIYPVGYMSNELIAIMEDTGLLGGRQVSPLNSGITVDPITSPFWRPLDEGWEPFRQMCINVESQYTDPTTTKIEVMESVRRYVEWFKWNGGYLNFYGHGLTTMTVGGIVRWDWIIEALKPYVDAGEVVLTKFSDGLTHMRTRDGATKTATGRGGNDKFTYDFGNDHYDEVKLMRGDEVPKVIFSPMTGLAFTIGGKIIIRGI